MSSKRLLYKPATQENVGNKDKRRTLAQGRLVTKPLLSQGISSCTLPSGALHNADISTSVAGDFMNSLTRSPQQVRIVSHSPLRDRKLLNQTGSPIRRASVPSPRRQAPYASPHKSVCLVEPSELLELSDTDSEVVFSHKSPARHIRPVSQEVLVVDATRQTKGPNESEVDIRCAYENSPAKIICHSPSQVHSDLRNTGSVEQARRVRVDQVPRVSVLGASDASSEAVKPTALFKSPLVIRENAVAGSTPSIAPKENIVQNLFTQFEDMRQLDDTALSTEGVSRLVTTASDSSLDNISRLSDGSEIDKPRTNVRIHTEPPKPKKMTISTADINEKVKKKTKVTRVVASRYMQVSSSKGPMKATDRSVLTKSNLKMNRTTGSKNRIGKQSSAKKKSNTSNFSSTPELRGSGGSTSTPSTDASHLTVPGGMDVSAIIPSVGQRHHSSLYSTPSLTETMLSATGRSGKKSSSKSKPKRRFRDSVHPISDTSKDSTDSVLSTVSAQDLTHSTHYKKKTQDITQWQLELHYARYLQWVFLDSKSRKTFEEQEKQAMAQMYGLWDENQKLQERKADLELQLNKLKHMNMLDETLEIQHSGLGPVIANVSKMKQEYSTLAQAVDTTRHQIPTRGIFISQEENQYHDALLHSLLETEQLLGELSVMTRQKIPKVEMFSKEINAIERTVQEECQVLSKCQELMSAAATLATQESSLRIQDMQLEAR